MEHAERGHDRPSRGMEKGPLTHVLPQPFNAMRVLTDKDRRKQIAHRRRNYGSAAAACVAKADAFEAVGCFNADEAIIPGGDAPCRETRFDIERNASDAGLH